MIKNLPHGTASMTGWMQEGRGDDAHYTASAMGWDGRHFQLQVERSPQTSWGWRLYEDFGEILQRLVTGQEATTALEAKKQVRKALDLEARR